MPVKKSAVAALAEDKVYFRMKIVVADRDPGRTLLWAGSLPDKLDALYATRARTGLILHNYVPRQQNTKKSSRIADESHHVVYVKSA
ncbi:MAG: hypothetical protein ABI171_00090 [Collimonas sp.]|uniref:hypothetical protein n=1 Tax=Collimonas sp. TaxID=1963772 RepID=UPI003263CFD7